MPYIKKEQRSNFEPHIDELVASIKTAGDANYIITRLLSSYYEMCLLPSYDKVNTVMGILESVKQEYYRRVAVPYEDKKAVENGDVY